MLRAEVERPRCARRAPDTCGIRLEESWRTLAPLARLLSFLVVTGDSGVPGTSDVVDARSHIMDALSNRRSRARRRSCLRLGALLRTTAAGAVEPRAREEIRVGVSVPRLFELLYCHVFQELSNKK